jgi:hypothetical protein
VKNDWIFLNDCDTAILLVVYSTTSSRFQMVVVVKHLPETLTSNVSTCIKETLQDIMITHYGLFHVENYGWVVEINDNPLRVLSLKTMANGKVVWKMRDNTQIWREFTSRVRKH